MNFGSLPRLSHLNLSFYDEPNARPDPLYADFFGPPNEHSELRFPCGFPDLENLVVRYTGPEKWFAKPDLHMPSRNVRRLLVADMPCSWDISWTCCILEATAPYLETLHVHIDDHNFWEPAYSDTYAEPQSSFKHRVEGGGDHRFSWDGNAGSLCKVPYYDCMQSTREGYTSEAWTYPGQGALGLGSGGLACRVPME